MRFGLAKFYGTVLLLGCGLAGLTGCKSYWIDATVENQTGAAIHELEVEYPTASFGSNGLAAGGAMHYRLQVRGNGPIKVAYTAADGKTIHLQGPNLAEHEQGQITVRLLAAGKVEYLPKLEPGS
jgi:hypothetical protein